MKSLEMEVREYLQLLNKLYEDKEMVIGVNTTPLEINKPEKFMNHMLYYADGKLTDTFYIKNVVSSPTFSKLGPVYCYGDIEIGDFVTTSCIYGVCIKAPNKEVSFGKVTKIYENNHKKENNIDIIRLIDVEFI